MLEDLKFSGLQGEDLDNPLSGNGVTLVFCLLHIKTSFSALMIFIIHCMPYIFD